MKPIQQRKDGTKLLNMRIRFEDHANDVVLAPISAVRKQITIVDDTKPVQVDSMRLALIFTNIRAKDFKYYFYILARLERNDKPIKAGLSEMRIALKDKWNEQVYLAITRLIAVGLIFRVEGHKEQYLVNPVYAWKGNRFDYLDTDCLEVLQP